jgi:GTPase SAR1 family protein
MKNIQFGSSEHKTSVCLLGLPGSGKTLLFQSAKLESKQKVFGPTDGFNVEEFESTLLNFLLWDFGGHTSQYWPFFLENVSTHMVVFVVKAANWPRDVLPDLELQKAKNVLREIS